MVLIASASELSATGSDISKQPMEADAITGLWMGYYEYNNRTSQPDLPFSLLINQPNSKKLGLVFLEPNPHDAQRFGRLAGIKDPQIIDKDTIKFVKVYNEEMAPVYYTLNVFKNNTVMFGKWRISDETNGTAFFIKVTLEELRSIRESFLSN